MKPTEIAHLAAELDLCLKELAYLLGVSERTLRRGVNDGGTVDFLLCGIRERMDDPQTRMSVRAMAIMAARSGGMKTLVSGLLRSYAKLDVMLHKEGNP